MKELTLENVHEEESKQLLGQLILIYLTDLGYLTPKQYEIGDEIVNLQFSLLSRYSKNSTDEIPQYRYEAISQKIDKGSFASFYAIQYTFKFHEGHLILSQHQSRAIKLINFKHSNYQMILNEYNLMSRLHYLHVKPPIFGLYYAWLVMDRLPGYDMVIANDADKLNKIDANARTIQELSVTEALKLFIAMVEALEIVHKAGIVHRDIKPDNFIVTNDLKVYLIDFGLSIPSEYADSVSKNCGSEEYMAPEALHNKANNERSDIYSLGFVIHLYAVKVASHGKFLDQLNERNKNAFIKLIFRMVEEDPGVRVSLCVAKQVLNRILVITEIRCLQKHHLVTEYFASVKDYSQFDSLLVFLNSLLTTQPEYIQKAIILGILKNKMQEELAAQIALLLGCVKPCDAISGLNHSMQCEIAIKFKKNATVLDKMLLSVSLNVAATMEEEDYSAGSTGVQQTIAAIQQCLTFVNSIQPMTITSSIYAAASSTRQKRHADVSDDLIDSAPEQPTKASKLTQ